MTHPQTTPANAALATLALLQLTMLGSLYAQIAPHPPAVIPLFAIAPFLAVSLSAIAAAYVMGSSATRAGRILCSLAALGALLSFGPQKYFDPQFSLIWPAVICGQFAAITLFYCAFRAQNPERTPS